MSEPIAEFIRRTSFYKYSAVESLPGEMSSHYAFAHEKHEQTENRKKNVDFILLFHITQIAPESGNRYQQNHQSWNGTSRGSALRQNRCRQAAIGCKQKKS